MDEEGKAVAEEEEWAAEVQWYDNMIYIDIIRRCVLVFS